MAVCDFCNTEMDKGYSCKRIVINNKGKEYEPIKYGDEDGNTWAEESPCGDCNVKKGGYHHPGCDEEQCPV